MSKPILARAAVAAAVALGLAGSFYAGHAMAADPNLDLALQKIGGAITDLQAAQNQGVNPPFGSHRDRAIRLLRRAQEQVNKAKAYADSHPPGEKKPGKGKKDGE